jgi:hypothetical protein
MIVLQIRSRVRAVLTLVQLGPSPPMVSLISRMDTRRYTFGPVINMISYDTTNEPLVNAPTGTENYTEKQQPQQTTHQHN